MTSPTGTASCLALTQQPMYLFFWSNDMQTYVQVNWNAIAAISSATYTSLFLISIFIIWEQLRGLRRALYAQSFSDALDRLQNDSVRAARAQLFALREKSVDTWTKEEE